jgi:FOG: GAF domain
MATTRDVAQAERDLIRNCHSGLDASTLQRRVLRSLRRLMSVDAAFFATADPGTLLFTGAYAEEPLDTATPLFLDNEFGTDDVNKFASLATSAVHVASLDSATRLDRRSSGRYRDIMAPLGLGDELRAALVAGTDCWGYLCLHRTDHPLGFTAQEAALLARAGPHIAHGLRQAVLLHRGAPAGTSRVPGWCCSRTT